MISSVESIISSMPRIGLADLGDASLTDRVDTKYVLSQQHLHELLERVAPEYRVLCVADTCLSPYRTLYFDTPGCDCFVQHHNGKLNRHKVRIREYTSSGACFLEIKSKSNRGRTTKKRIPLDMLIEELPEDSTGLIRERTGIDCDFVPQLWTNFKRLTLVNHELSERVTLDIDLEFRYRGEDAQLPGIVIAEVKQQRDNRHTTVRNTLRLGHVHPLRVSKYCLGTVLLKPQLKYNRFKSKLAAVRRIAAGNRA